MDAPGSLGERTRPELEKKIALLEQRIAALETLQEVAHTLASELRLDRLLALILSNAMDVLKATAGSLLLLDKTTNELVFQVVQGGGGKALLNKRIRTDEGIAGWVFTRRLPATVHHAASDPRFLTRMDETLAFQTVSLLAAPLIYKSNPIGVIEVLNKQSGERFNADDQELLMAFAAQSAIVIENARLYQQIVAERDRILAVEEEVRRELARDLHDGPSQILASLVMGLKHLRNVIARQPERTDTEVTDLERLATTAMHQVRNMLFDLRPVALETQGLHAALQVYVERLREANGTPVFLEADDITMRFAPKIEGAVFSIVQEAVGNAKKHAHAKSIWISARETPEILVLSVRDDGKGFDVASVEEAYAQRGSLGLLNMKERAELARGKLTIDSKIGKGTKVTLAIPLKPPSESNGN
ncbi:MAG: GAF domain-containing sensor histidine kinase [Chloroflexi bacterium]|nr:GAF domain-containing sensor histidine kinase [Chloroflexota bacterium]